jgi:hypothetical protein
MPLAVAVWEGSMTQSVVVGGVFWVAVEGKPDTVGILQCNLIQFVKSGQLDLRT